MIGLQSMLSTDIKRPQAIDRTGDPPLRGDEFAAPPVPRVILARPLFAPSRGIGPISSKDGGGQLEGAFVAGSVSIRGRAYVIIQTPSGPSANLRIGGTISGWRLVGLSADTAQFARGKERRNLPFGEPSGNIPAAAEGLSE